LALITLHPTEEGIDRLLHTMVEAGCYATWSAPDRPYNAADQSLQTLFRGYRKLLEKAREEAEPWWEGTVLAESSDGQSITPEAVEAAFDKRAAGPASDPRVVWVVRMVWMECVKRNNRLPPAEQVRPEYLMVQWLIDVGEAELVRLIACMPYWPIGLDENGEWC
jgi:hypothetical protein